MKDLVSAHQMGVMASILLFTLKLTNLPSFLYESSGTGAIIDITIICLINILFIGLIVWIKLKHKNKSFYNILCEAIGTFLTKIIYLVLLAFFIFKILSIVSNGYIFIKDVADEEFTMVKFMICFLPVVCALSYSGLKNIGRTCEFFYPLILMGLLVCVLFSFVPITFWGVGNIFRNPISTHLNSLAKFSFWSGDLLTLILFIDKIEIKKGKIRKIFIPTIIMSIILITTYFVYYSLYQETSVFHTNLIYDIVQYAMWTSTGWHMDIFAILVFMFNLFLQGAIFVFSAKECVNKIFNYNNKKITLPAILFLILSLEFLYLRDFLQYVTFGINFLSYYTLGCLSVIIITVIISTIKKQKGKQKDAKT